MVSDKKMMFYKKRLNEIRESKWREIDMRHPEVQIDHRDLIRNGKAKMMSEKEIRGMVGKLYNTSCPITIDIVKLFKFDDERDKAVAENEMRNRVIAEERAVIHKAAANALDLVYLGTEEQLLKALREMEAM